MSDPSTYGATIGMGRPAAYGGSSTDGSSTDFPPPQTKTMLEAVSPYFAEFLGTFMLVFTACVCSAVGDPTWNATAVACILASLIYVFGPVSGGHLNPAVSFATGLAGKESWNKVCIYILLQFGAGLCAGELSVIILEQSLSIAPAPAFQKTFYPLIIEVVYTTFLCFVVLNVAYSRRNNSSDDQNHFFGLAIAFVVIAGGYAGGNVSGACLNPAVTLGLDTSGPWPLPKSWWPYEYVASQMLGAVLAAALFKLVRPEERFQQSPMPSPLFESPLYSKVISEFFGTFMLVLTVGLCVIMNSTMTAWAAAASLMCAIYALGDVSGAHLNPAVTLAVMLSGRGKCPVLRGLVFMVVQVLAGFLGGLLLADFHDKGPNASQAFCLTPLIKTSSSGMTYETWEPVFWGEFTFTALLAFTVLVVATAHPPASLTRTNFHFGLVIGACITAGGFAAGKVSGGELNPAVAVALSTSCQMSSSAAPVGFPGAYLVNIGLFELAGGFCAAVVFALTHSQEFHHVYENKQLLTNYH